MPDVIDQTDQADTVKIQLTVSREAHTRIKVAAAASQTKRTIGDVVTELAMAHLLPVDGVYGFEE